MRAFEIALALAAILGAARGQSAPPPPAEAPSQSAASLQAAREPENAATRAMRHRFGLIATRSIAYFRISDMLDENLMAEGIGLSGEILVLRLRLGTELDRTDEALRQGDLAAAGKALDRAQGLLDRFAARLGG